MTNENVGLKEVERVSEEKLWERKLQVGVERERESGFCLGDERDEEEERDEGERVRAIFQENGELLSVFACFILSSIPLLVSLFRPSFPYLFFN